MVGANDVLTASHVVYDAGTGAVPVSVTVTAGYDPDLDAQPFGTVEAASWHYSGGFDPDGDGLIAAGNGGAGLAGSEQDLALIDLAIPLGVETGWMDIDPDFESGYVNVTGYPGVSGFEMTNDFGHVSDHRIDNVTYTDGLELHPGNSGGPLWYQGEDGPAVVGVVSTGLAACDVAAFYDTLTGLMAANDVLMGVA
jgi:V8-like Glu-specific endopeptidase